MEETKKIWDKTAAEMTFGDSMKVYGVALVGTIATFAGYAGYVSVKEKIRDRRIDRKLEKLKEEK